MQKIISLFQRNYDGDRLDELKSEELAYIAGIVDGEGSFYIYMKSGGISNKKYHRSALKIANSELVLIKWLCERIGGTISTSKPKNPNHKVVYHLAVEGPKMSRLIDFLLPYLVIKKQQAELAKEMQSTMTLNRGVSLSDEILIRRDEIYKAFITYKHGDSLSWGGKRLVS